MTPAIANAAVAVKPVGMSATAYIMLVFVLVSVPLLAAILRQLIKNAPEMKKLENEGDASLRHDLLARISTLEMQMLEKDKACEEKLTAMQKQIDGLVRQLVQYQVSSGRAMHMTPEADAAIDRVSRIIQEKGA